MGHEEQKLAAGRIPQNIARARVRKPYAWNGDNFCAVLAGDGWCVVCALAVCNDDLVNLAGQRGQQVVKVRAAVEGREEEGEREICAC